MSKLTLAAKRLSLHPLLATCLFGLSGLLVQNLSLADDGSPREGQAMWHWQGDCDPMTAPCTVWFNHFSPAANIRATLDSRQLPVESTTLAELQQATAQAFVIQVANDSDEVSSTLQTLLRSTLTQRRAVHRLGLFLGQQNLRVLAPLATENSTSLTEALPQIKGGADSSSAIRNLTQVIGMLGGVDASRKVLTWITDHPALSADEVALLREELASDNIRLMILALRTDAMAATDASEPTIWPDHDVAQAYIEAAEAEQAGLLLAEVTDNGFQLTVPALHRCGNGTLTWQADLQASALQEAGSVSRHIDVNAPPCPDTLESDAVPEEPGTLDTDTGQHADAPELADEPVSAEEAEASTPDEGDSTPDSTAETDASSEAPVSAEGTMDQGTSDAWLGNTSLVVIGAIAVLLIILLGLVLTVARNRHKTSPTLTGVKPPQAAEQPAFPAASSPTEIEPTRVIASGSEVYAELLAADTTPTQRYPLSAASVSIGRSQNNLVVLSDDTVSAFHAVITRQRSGELVLADLKSSNGTKVNGKPQTHCALHDGDIIEFGECRLALMLR